MEKKTLKYMDKGRFIRFDSGDTGGDKRYVPDRRKTLRGDATAAENGTERRVGARRLEDVLITMEVSDGKGIYTSSEVLFEIVNRVLQKDVPLLEATAEEAGLAEATYGDNQAYLETKLKYRDKIKKLMLRKGLTCKIVDMGAFLGDENRRMAEAGRSNARKPSEDHEKPEAAKTAIHKFTPEEIKQENESIVFKVFAKCLNQVHPLAADYEREALKQSVSLEQRIIFLMEKHYPKSKKYAYLTSIDQVIDILIKSYNDIIQLEAEKTNLEERYRLSSNTSLLNSIQKKETELQQIRKSPLTETLKTLYLYLDFFKEIFKVGTKKSRIEHVFKRVNDRNIQIMRFEEIHEIIDSVLALEEEIMKKKPKERKNQLKLLNGLKEAINNEIYFIKYLWINNVRGRKYILNAKDKAFGATHSA
ncbi:MAG: hypothetical protein GY866_09080 [Proteobacteria bacterium]|nr:hypothetical protein [Pseudomonadota bacterium]